MWIELFHGSNYSGLEGTLKHLYMTKPQNLLMISPQGCQGGIKRGRVGTATGISFWYRSKE